MASVYDFQNLESEISALEKKYSKFESEFDKTLSLIAKAKFNEKEYGKNALEKKTASIVSDAKNKISRKYNDYINGIRRASHDSLERIKKAANEAAEYVDDLNQSLSELEKLNTLFSKKQYRAIVTLKIDIANFDSDVSQYVLFLKLESYDCLCRDEIHHVNDGNYNDFERYYRLCIANNAEKHSINARKLLTEASYELVKTGSLNGNSVYPVCIRGLDAYSGLADTDKNQYKVIYSELYRLAITEFNTQSHIAYETFDYEMVKKYLKDALLFKDEDIQNSFFAGKSITPQKLLDYARSNGGSASQSTMQIVFNDTSELANGENASEFYAFWLSAYDRYGNAFISQLGDIQNDRFESIDVLSKVLIEEQIHIAKFGSCMLDLTIDYQKYLMSIKDQIPLYKLLQASVSWNKVIRDTGKSLSGEEAQRYQDAVLVLDGISYSMIVKYQKICSNFKQSIIDDLNVVLDDASNRVYGKPYRKDIKKSAVEDDSYINATVKLTTVEMKKDKKKKAIIWTSVAIAVIVALALLYIFVIKR